MYNKAKKKNDEFYVFNRNIFQNLNLIKIKWWRHNGKQMIDHCFRKELIMDSLIWIN